MFSVVYLFLRSLRVIIYFIVFNCLKFLESCSLNNDYTVMNLLYCNYIIIILWIFYTTDLFRYVYSDGSFSKLLGGYFIILVLKYFTAG